MTIYANITAINEDLVEIIKLFMSEAFEKINLRKGLGKNPNPETYDKTIGLFEAVVSFEAFITAIKPNEPSIWKKREFFCSTYQDFFIKFKDSCKVWINILFEELKNKPLIDMTPQPRTRPPIKINDKNNLHEIIEVIYRIRSNIIHGNKTLSSERNKKLIINSFHLINNILEHILKEEEII